MNETANDTMNSLIGNTAGMIWTYLSEKKTATAMKIKLELGISSGLLYLSLGWLARENKVEVLEENNTHKVVLIEQ